jgi:hypothetical protein
MKAVYESDAKQNVNLKLTNRQVVLLAQALQEKMKAQDIDNCDEGLEKRLYIFNDLGDILSAVNHSVVDLGCLEDSFDRLHY